jgi:hypothetical protein
MSFEQTNSFDIGLRVDQAPPIDVHLAMQKEEDGPALGHLNFTFVWSNDVQ